MPTQSIRHVAKTTAAINEQKKNDSVVRGNKFQYRQFLVSFC